jgi:hypothetical protein
MSGKEKAKMIRLRLFKEKEGGSPLKGQWKEKKDFFFTSSHFPPKQFYLNFHFFL